MLRAFGLRYLAIASLVFAVGITDVAMASVFPSSPQLYDLDMGDDDGDGIPNYLDPFDDRELNDPEAGTGAPANPPTDDLDLGDEDGDGIPNYLDPHDDREPVVSETPPLTPEEPAAGGNQEASTGQIPVAAQQVTSLPNTGVGIDTQATVSFTLLLLFIGAGILATSPKWHHRNP